MIIGHRIRQLRERRGITHDDVEQFSGLDRSYIVRIEQGRTVPPLEALERIAAALAVPLYWLFYAEEDAPGTGQASSPSQQRPAPCQSGEVQLRAKLEQVLGAPFDADPAFLLDFARKTALAKPEN